MKKKRLKAKVKELQSYLEVLEKKCAVLEIVVKWQSQKLDLKRELRIKREQNSRL
ncbi:hypothetical protein [Helicobacter sp. UBA3407]|uniref:hypothetical protein n=1 Tax=Helicobacter TaxID=209 RepID=UPI002608BC85|nr:hypothetical protein [Helicobacter sp. UBA3407]